MYGAHKVSIDKFAADMAVDFGDSNVACLFIWMDTLLTERVEAMVPAEPDKYGYLVDTMETPQLTGHVIWALFNDSKLMEKSGQMVIGVEAAKEYGVTDREGRMPPSSRDTFGVYPLPQFDKVIR